MFKNMISIVVVAGLVFALTAASQQADAAVIYNETFVGTGDLNGTAPDTTTGGNTWTASPNWNEDGTVDAGSGDDSAFLAFTPVTGKVYTLSAALTQPSSGTWGAIGFTENANISTGGDDDFWKNIPTNTAPWVLYRTNSNVDSFLGPLTGGVEDEGDHTGPLTLSIVLNTEGAAWTAEWFVDASSVRSETFASNPTGINYVGFSRENGTSVVFSDFSLTVVPEPATMSLLALGGLAILRRRRGKRA